MRGPEFRDCGTLGRVCILLYVKLGLSKWMVILPRYHRLTSPATLTSESELELTFTSTTNGLDRRSSDWPPWHRLLPGLDGTHFSCQHIHVTRSLLQLQIALSRLLLQSRASRVFLNKRTRIIQLSSKGIFNRTTWDIYRFVLLFNSR